MFFIQEFIHQRIRELTSEKNMIMYFQHLVLQPNEIKIIKAGTDIYLLSDVVDDIKVESENGLFDWGTILTNEQVYEHSGDIWVENLSSNINHLPCIQFTNKIKLK